MMLPLVPRFFPLKLLSLFRKQITILLFIGSQQLFAQTRLPAIIGSNMVLQRNTMTPVWGWSAPGAQVHIGFAGQLLTAVAGKDSLWQVKLKPLMASSIPQTMTITVARQQIKLDNILVGEVWICSGQSNMEYPVDKAEYHYANPAKGIDSASLEMQNAHPGIRVIKIERSSSFPDVTTTGWQESEGKNFARSSVVAYFFAKQLQAELGIPVGVVTSAWNGSRIETWAPSTAYAALPVFRDEISKNDSLMDGEHIGKMFRSMIFPLAPFAIKGFIWYQGESNCLIEEHDMRYTYKMQALIESWRKLWGARLPFYYVLIAPFVYTEWKNNIPHTTETLPVFWEQQIAAAQIPNTGFIATTDLVDNIKDIHPSYKWIVGRRLANLALANTYGQKSIDCLPPQYDHKKIKGGNLIVYFKNCKRLKTLDEKAPGFFEIAGSDGKYLPADATIKGRTVVLSNTGIKDPVDARLGWTESASPNLINSAGLPAIPFRTKSNKWSYQPTQ